MFNSFHRWLDRKLRVDAYELCGDEVVSRGLPRRRIRLQEICTWQEIYIGGGVPFICVQFTNGRTDDFSDKYEQLLHVLQKVASEKEIPFTHF